MSKKTQPGVRYLFREEEQGTFQLVSGGGHRFLKDAIRTGTFNLDGGEKLVVTPKRMAGWVDTFKRMQAAGVKVPFPVDHSKASRDNWGWVEDLRLDGDRLMTVVEVPLEEHARVIGKTIREVSIGVNPNYTDDEGRHWGECVRHISPCTYPRVSGQGDFVPFEGRDDDEEVVLCRRAKGVAMNWKERLQKLLDLKGDLSDEAVDQALEEKLTKHAAVLREAKDGRDQAVGALKTLREEKTALEARLQKLGPATDGTDKEETDPKIVELRREVDQLRGKATANRILALRDTGRINPAIEKLLTPVLSLRELNLRQVEIEGKEQPASEIVARAFEMLPPGAALDLKERTKLLREVANPNDTDKETPVAELRAAGAKLAEATNPRPAK